MWGPVRILALLALIATLVSSHAGQAAGQPGAEPAAASLAGRFLVATEALDDPNFSRTVVYLIQHDAEGAAGVVINRVVARGPLARLLEGFGVRTAGEDGTMQIRVHYGGPVEPGRVMVLHSAEYQIEGTTVLRDRVALTRSTQVLEDIAAGHGPERSLLAFGHAGWAPDQLESEITAGAWVTVPGDPELLFDDDIRTKWQRATARQGFDL